MAIRDIKKIPTYENNINTQVAQGQIQRTQQAQENPEYNNWGALGPIANGIASIGKSISSVFEQQDITRQNDNVAKMQKAYQLEIESKTADPREMKEIIADLDKWYIDYAEGLDLSEKDRKTLDTAALKYQTIRTQDWGARKAIANRELQGEQIQALLKEAEARNASVEELTQIVYGQNTAGRYPGNLADIADEYFDKKMLEAVHTDFEKKKLGEATVTGVGLQELKSTEVDTEALRQESYNYAKSLETQWNVEHKRDSIYSDLEADLLIKESVSRRNYQTIYQDYLTLPLDEAIDRLNGEIVYDADDVVIPLTIAQKEEMKTVLTDSARLEATAQIVSINRARNLALEFLENGGSGQELLESKDPKFKDLNTTEILTLIENRNDREYTEKNQEYNLMNRERSEMERAEDQRIETFLNENKITNLDELYVYTTGNKQINSADVAKYIRRLTPAGSDPKKLSYSESDSRLQAYIRALNDPETNVAVLMGQAFSDFETHDKYGEYLLHSDHYKEFTKLAEDVKGFRSLKDVHKYIENSEVIDKMRGSDEVHAAVIREAQDAMTNLYRQNPAEGEVNLLLTDKEYREAADEIIGALADKELVTIWESEDQRLLKKGMFYNPPLEKAIPYMNNGEMNLLMYTEDGRGRMKEIQSLLNASYASIYGGTPEILRYQNGVVPVYNHEGKEMVWDVAFNQPKLVEFSKAAAENEALSTGIPIGKRNGYLTVLKTGQYVLSDSTVNYISTYKVEGNEVSIFEPVDEKGNPYPNETTYMAYDSGAETVIKVFGENNDLTSVAAAYKDITKVIDPGEAALKKIEDEIKTQNNIDILKDEALKLYPGMRF